MLGGSRFSFLPWKGCLKITRWAGRFTPAARVEVAVSTDTAPWWNAVSTTARSSADKPARAEVSALLFKGRGVTANLA